MEKKANLSRMTIFKLKDVKKSRIRHSGRALQDAHFSQTDLVTHIISYGSMPLIMNPPTYPIQGDANTLHPTTGLCTQLLGFALDYWASHATTGLLT